MTAGRLVQVGPGEAQTQQSTTCCAQRWVSLPLDPACAGWRTGQAIPAGPQGHLTATFQNTGAGVTSMPSTVLRITARSYHCPSGMCVTILVLRTWIASAMA